MGLFSRKRVSEKIPYKDEYNDVGGGDLLIDEIIRGPPYAGGDFLLGRADMDQVITINPDCLPGQAEIIMRIFRNRLAKWHFVAAKANEYVQLNPIDAPPFFNMLQQKEKLERYIKGVLSQITHVTADYELFKSDVRKYAEILDYFAKAKKGEEHLLRSFFVDRVDAMGEEATSLVTMARRWPTIITDFIRLREDMDSIEEIQKELQIPRAEAVVLRSKNELYKQWKNVFFYEVKRRYASIKNLMLSTEKQLDEYSNWIKPYITKYKSIRENAEFSPSFNVTNPQVFAFTPFSGERMRLWFFRGFEPEEMHKPFVESGRFDPVDDFVIKWTELIEKHYGVSFVREYNKKYRKNLPEDDYDSRKIAVKDFVFGKGGKSEIKRTHELVQYQVPIDKRYMYFAFYDIDYEADYIKGSQGPLEMEDIYYNIYPCVVSINLLIVMHLELRAKELRFERYVEKLIGTSNIEVELKKELEEFLGEREKEIIEVKETIRKMVSRWRRNSSIDSFLKFFRKKGPYETNIKERIEKEFSLYLGNWTDYVYEVLKEACYKMSGVRP